MRFTGLVLVIISLAMGMGGVSYTRAAETQTVAASDLTSAEPQQCLLKDAAEAVRLRPIPLPQGGEHLTLNTRGYNYRRPGEQVPSLEGGSAPASPRDSQAE